MKVLNLDWITNADKQNKIAYAYAISKVSFDEGKNPNKGYRCVRVDRPFQGNDHYWSIRSSDDLLLSFTRDPGERFATLYEAIVKCESLEKVWQENQLS